MAACSRRHASQGRTRDGSDGTTRARNKGTQGGDVCKKRAGFRAHFALFLFGLLLSHVPLNAAERVLDATGGTCAFASQGGSLTDVLELARSEENVKFVTDLRRELHKIPELLFKLPKTSALVQKTLEELGIEFEAGWACTGVIATVGTGQQPIVALRADMDGLAIQEDNKLDFVSVHKGKMHACGHDVHTSMLLAAAKILKSREDQLTGTVKLIFQPAEEGGAGGKKLIEEEALKDVQRVFAFHVWPGLPTGIFAGNAGVVTAASGIFHVRVQGKGGHGAMPHTTIDPVVSAASIISSLQSIVSRETDPLSSSVISVTRIQGGSADNVIPETVDFGGTLRSLSLPGLEQLQKRVVEVATAQASVSGCNATVEFALSEHPVYPPTVNNDTSFSFARDVGKRLLGEGSFIESIPTMGAEDFGFYLEKVPGSLLLLGIMNETVGSVHALHHPKFLVDENVLPIGAAFHVALAEECIKSLSSSSDC